ncbi:MAG: pitrilysin family protein [Patescibacteria group bacterium]
MEQFTLKNGLRVLFAPAKGTETVTATVLVRVGSRYEYKKVNGASHFVEHLLFKGTKRRPTAQHISRALDAIGADFNAFTDKHVTGYYTKVDNTHLALALDILSDMLFHSTFDAKELARERTVVIEEINMYKDNPSSHVEELLEDALFLGSTLGWNIAGSQKTMTEMPRTEILEYYKTYYRPGNMVLVVAGNIDAQARALVEKYFGNKTKQSDHTSPFVPFATKSSKEKSPLVRLQTKKTEQVQLAIGFPSYGIDDDKNTALSLLSIILGGNMSSRLFVQVREKRGLAYTVRASNQAYDDVGAFVVRAGLDKKRLALAVATILKELRALVKSGVTQTELDDAKTFVRGQLSIRMEDSASRAQWFATEEMFEKKIHTPQEYLDLIDKVTVLDVKAIAKELIDFEKMCIAVIGPYKDRADFLKKAGL